MDGWVPIPLYNLRTDKKFQNNSCQNRTVEIKTTQVHVSLGKDFKTTVSSVLFYLAKILCTRILERIKWFVQCPIPKVYNKH